MNKDSPRFGLTPENAGVYKLIGSNFSFFTAKAESYLRWKQIPYENIDATPDIYADVIVAQTGVRFIPVVVCRSFPALNSML